MKTKKLFRALAFSLIAASSLAFAACGGNDPATTPGNGSGSDQGGTQTALPEANAVDTYVGTVSDETYADENSAARAFFGNELFGKFVGYMATGDKLSASDIGRLGLADASKVKAVNAVNVSFKWELENEERSSGALTSAQENGVRTQKAYTIEYKDGSFGYYSPRPDNGEVLTKSYYMSILDGGMYIDHTVKWTENHQNFRSKYIEDTNSYVDVLHNSTSAHTFYIGDDKMLRHAEHKSFNKENGEMVKDDDDSVDDYTVAATDGKVYNIFEFTPSTGEPEWRVQSTRVDADGNVKLERNGEFAYNIYATWNNAVADSVFGETGMYDFYSMCSLFEKTPTGFKATDEAFAALELGEELTKKEFYFDIKNGMLSKIVIDATWTENGEQLFDRSTAEVTADDDINVTVPQKFADTLDDAVQKTADDIKKHTVANAAAWTAAFDYGAETNYTVNYEERKERIDGNGYQTYSTKYTSTQKSANEYMITISERKFYGQNEENRQTVYAKNDNGVWSYKKQAIDENTGESIWENVNADPPISTPFEDVVDVSLKFDECYFDVAMNSYVVWVTVDGVQYACTVKIDGGKVVEMHIEYTAEGNLENGGKATFFNVDSVFVRDVGSTVVIPPVDGRDEENA